MRDNVIVVDNKVFTEKRIKQKQSVGAQIIRMNFDSVDSVKSVSYQVIEEKRSLGGRRKLDRGGDTQKGKLFNWLYHSLVNDRRIASNDRRSNSSAIEFCMKTSSGSEQ